jgi:hypothetical protein
MITSTNILSDITLPVTVAGGPMSMFGTANVPVYSINAALNESVIEGLTYALYVSTTWDDFSVKEILSSCKHDLISYLECKLIHPNANFLERRNAKVLAKLKYYYPEFFV